MFDFLAEDDDGAPRRTRAAATPADRPLPVIRKPVPVSESGPLLPPKPGAPVEPPPELTSGSERRDVDLDFLDEDAPEPRRTQPRTIREPGDSARSNVTRLDTGSRRRAATGESANGRADSGSMPPVRRQARPENEFDALDLDDSLQLDEDWHRGPEVRFVDDHDSDQGSGRGRWVAMVLALLLIAVGVGSFVFTNPPAWLKLPGSDRDPTAVTGIDPELDAVGTGADSSPVAVDSLSSDTAAVFTPSPLMQKFRAELDRLEQLLAAGSLDEAEAALKSMDRSIYGYGATEFAAIENRIDQLRSGDVSPEQNSEQAEATRLAEEQAAREAAVRQAEQQAAREEAARLAEEQAAREAAVRQAEQQAAREEAARLAEEQAAREAAVRQAEQQAAREEAARLAEEQAAREEAVRQAEQQAALEEAARLAEEQTAREEAARQAELQSAREAAARRAEEQAARIEQIRLAEEAARTEAERLAQSRSQADSAATAALSEAQTIDRDRIATDRRIAEERAALQRQQAREQRLIEAREREAQAEQARAAVQGSNRGEPETGSPSAADRSANQASDNITAASTVVSDADLQLVYQRFVNLQRAISQRDINAVVSLTQRSGARVQQFMQIFENSSEIDARIKNVSTSNATGEIKGTLQINRIRRANGSYVQPPASLSAIPLSSKRDENGWSAISW